MRKNTDGAGNGWNQMSYAERMARLSPRRQEIIRPALEHPQQHILLSVRDLAEKLSTDPATTVRIVQGMGFETYKHFQRYLHELSVASATSLDMMQSSKSNESSVTAKLQDALEHEMKNLRALHTVIDLEGIAAAARRLWKAKRILLLGGDLAASLIAYLDYHLNVIGMPVTSATSPGLASHAVRALGEGDVLFAISFRRGLRMTVEGVKEARKQGAYCIGLTDTYSSPIVRHSHDFFLTSIDTNSFGASYTTPMLLLNLLMVACAEVNRRRTLEFVKRAHEEQRHGFRWYEV